MRIAILGWGSLIWELRSLEEHVRGGWKIGGPQLPLEFSRKSRRRSDALTIVIDTAHGQGCLTRFITSARRKLDKAIEDLKDREGVPSADSIGFANLSSGETRDGTEKTVKAAIRSWAIKKNYDAVVWTALKSNFKCYSVERALLYLAELPPEGKAKAKEYIENAPDEIVTPLRKALSESDFEWDM